MTTNTSDADYVAAGRDALAKGIANAELTAQFWAKVAATVTAYRAECANRLPKTPDSAEEWFESSQPYLPFNIGELTQELAALSGIATKAHTIANVYAVEADRLREAWSTFSTEDTQDLA
ncbi:hypothetical protein IU433_14180 [Nocardia puris]|uniref:hypothetical protein n=1 Tax=Nocardia puris TaxID=208602 RepID=UPI001893F1C6|nr:hypothetical protein [Nocardia puris]MBF6460185.1 hypothetical protein [Nocardia puris]